MSVVWRWPRRPAWLYPLDTQIKTRHGIFKTVEGCDASGCRIHSTWAHLRVAES